MNIDIEKLAARVAALEHQRNTAVAADEKKDDAKVDDKKVASERETLASEIEALEKRIGTVASGDVKVAADDEKKDEAKVEDKAEEKKASLVDPNGVEEQITQKRLTEVENLEHGTELATGDSMLDVAPTEFVARLKNASERLDAVATYLEQTGRTEMALRVDRIANAIDARIEVAMKHKKPTSMGLRKGY